MESTHPKSPLSNSSGAYQYQQLKSPEATRNPTSEVASNILTGDTGIVVNQQPQSELRRHSISHK